jgi:hypothetical protein
MHGTMNPKVKTDVPCAACRIAFCLTATPPVCAVLQGRHIVKDNLTACPECDFPAILPELQLYVFMLFIQYTALLYM